MDLVNLFYGIGAIVIGVVLILMFQKFREKYGIGGLSFKIRTGGFGLIIIGIYLLFKELLKII